MKKPHFVIKNNFQRSNQKYSAILTPHILEDVCKRITGRTEYTYKFDSSGYNKGRLATLEYNGTIYFISFSEKNASGRNSSFQSFPTALVRYYKEKCAKKKIYFYLLPTKGNYETPYFIFMYRLMKTAGAEFLNEEYLKTSIAPFTSVDDIIAHRNLNKGRNRGNNSTFLTRASDNTIQIYGKTYGANKKETTLLCIALSKIADDDKIQLYQITEKNLSILPKPDLDVIKTLGDIETIKSDLSMERTEFEKNDSLRSPEYQLNLYIKFGDKKCAFCECEIPQLIQGAHILPVSEIKKNHRLNYKEKIKQAVDKDNGLWLCENHHKIIDCHLLRISKDGKLKIKEDLDNTSMEYIRDITSINQLPKEVFTPKFIEYLEIRNAHIRESRYCSIA